MRKHLSYGEVFITKGKYKGKVGFYDDDDTSCKIVVFINDSEDTVIINRDYVINIEETQHEFMRLCEKMIKRLLMFNGDCKDE